MDSDFLHFHITVISQAILEMTKDFRTPAAQLVATSAAGEELEGENTGLPYPPSQALLLHTQTGQPYTTSNVHYTLRRFVQNMYPELDSVTQMEIRASLATWQLRQYADPQCFVGFYDSSGHDQTITVSGTVGVARCDIGSVYSGFRTWEEPRRFCNRIANHNL
jgi:hypothetical protein